MRANHVKQQLRAGEVSIGTFMALGSPLGAEQLAQLGFDAVGYDTSFLTSAAAADLRAARARTPAA